MEGDPVRHNLEALRIDRSREAMPSRGRWIPWLVGLLVVAAVVTWAAVRWNAARPLAVRMITVVEASPGSRRGGTVLNASGYVTARRRATVSAKITGKLVDVRVEEGMPVTEGQVLALLDDAQLRAGLTLAESRAEVARRTADETGIRLELARLTLDRTGKLAAEGFSGQADLDAARTEVAALEARLALEQQQLQVARNEVALRRTELADTTIRAPFDGVVISKDAQVGEMVSPMSAGGGFTRTGICTIVDMQSLEIEIDVNEAYISRVHPGQPVEATLDAYPDWRIPASVITTVPAADRQRATVLVRIGFEELDPRILPDMGIKVAFQEPATSGEEPQEGPQILLPRAAVRRDGERDVVFVVNQGRAERRAVRVEGTGDPVRVVAGLGAGERVVLEAEGELTNGVALRERERER